jgi:arabinofuranosyltransferase
VPGPPTLPTRDATSATVTTVSHSPRGETAAHRLTRWALLALPVVVLAERAWSRRWMSDDGFINLRVVRQITSGNGPVFNAGERVEAATSPLWVGLLAVGDVVTPIRLEWVAVLAGIALTLVGIGFAIAGARLLMPARSASELYLPAGAAVLVAVTPVWTFASSGLEGGLTSAWLGTSLWALARWAAAAEHPLPLWAAVISGLGVLIRPDLGIFTVLFLTAVLMARWRAGHWPERVRVLGAALALPIAYEIFRMGYYASLVPSPALAKEAGSARWSDGWDYLSDSFGPYAVWLPLVVLTIGAYYPLVRAARCDGRPAVLLVTGAFVIGALLQTVYIVRVGGDFMHARLLLPAFFAAVAPVAVVPLRREFALALLVLPWCVVSLFFLRADADDAGAFGTGELNLITLEDFGWEPGGSQRAWFDGQGVYYGTTKLDAETVDGRDAEVASYGLGIIGYSLGPDVYVLDLLGLGDPFTSHLELERRGLIGHEKPLPAPWIVARLTPDGTVLSEDDFPFPTNFGARPLGDPDRASFDDRVTRARNALTCEDLRHFLDAYTESLTPGRFLSNVVRAPGYTVMRIPPEPEDAYREFCD